MERNNIIEELTLQQLKSKQYKFRIPLYQRKYAWTSDEVTTLLDDLKTFNTTKTDRTENEKYFIGNIVVEQKPDGLFDIIDGQQRFTTLYLIAKIVGQKYYDLLYEIREEDGKFLENFNYDENKEIEYCDTDIQFKENIEAILKFKKENSYDIYELLSFCKIALTILPDGIDIVKYFEVMNNRGKQLEKHQLLKAKLLDVISDDDNINYAKIWDYCSNMNVYIEDSIYYVDLKEKEKNIENKVREPLKNFLNHNSIPDFFSNREDMSYLTINDILNPNNQDKTKAKKEEFYVRQEYGTIIKFPIFIIQVLKIFIVKNSLEELKLKNIVVNDGHLMSYFNKDGNLILNSDKSKEFILFLLKMRLLYDYFIFKRDSNDTPILNTSKNIFKSQNQDEIKNILMLQLLFNFTAPQRIAQDWLAVALNWLSENCKNGDDNIYKNFSEFLEKLDRNMALTRLSEEKDLVGLVNKYLLKEEIDLKFNEASQIEEVARLNNGTSTQHYWLYKLDYLLLKNTNIWNDLEYKFTENAKFKYSSISSNFRLSRLNSIEHIYPQSKKEDWQSFSVDNFGNLALISNHMNSALIDKEYSNKKLKIQEQLNNGTIESLKMILIYSKYEEWNPQNCQNHHEEMINLLIEDLKNEPK